MSPLQIFVYIADMKQRCKRGNVLISIGFKPGQRKVVFTCLKRNLVRELKVAQLAGSVAELSAYHHGEVGASCVFDSLKIIFLLRYVYPHL